MKLFEILFRKDPPSASVAKERLQIVLAHERIGRDGPDFLPQLQRDLLAVVARYVAVRDDMIKVNLEKTGSASVLEINVEFPQAAKSGTAARAGTEALAP